MFVGFSQHTDSVLLLSNNIYCWLSVQGTSLQVFRDLDSFLLKMEVYHLSYPFVSSKFILSTSCHWHLTSGVSSELLLTTAHFKLELEWRVWWTVYTSCVPPECNQLDDITSFQKTALLNNLLWSKHVHWEVSQSVFTGPVVVGKCPSSVLPFSRLLSLLKQWWRDMLCVRSSLSVFAEVSLGRETNTIHR